MFKIAIVGGPCEKYIEKCILSFLDQDEKDWEIQIVLDPIDNSYDIAKSYESEKIKVIRNETKKGALHNFSLSFDKLNCNDDDIIVTMDGDDWLYSSSSLSIVKRYYEQDILLTYGSWIGHPQNPNPIVKRRDLFTNFSNDVYGAYTDEDWDIGIRNSPWKATQLRTMKYKVWKNIDILDFKDENGDFLFVADKAFMLPALEMVGRRRAKHVSEIIYVYNKEGIHDPWLGNMESTCHFISSKKPYVYKEDF